VFTIGNVQLSATEIDLLEHGLSYVPVLPNAVDPNADEIESLAQPINKTIRAMQKAAQANDATYLVRLGLNLIPPQPAKSTGFAYTTKLVETMSGKHSATTALATEPNLTPNQLEVLEKLRRNRNFIIKPVDKNLGVAVIEKDLYIRLAQAQHLGDTKTYTKLEQDPLIETIALVNNTLAQLKQDWLLTTAEAKRLAAKQDSTNGVFYILPKLHKGKLDSRPICSNSSHPTRQVSNHLHSELLPTAKASFSYLDNSLELTKLLTTIQPTKTMVILTADIKSLYTNIPTSEGPQVVADKTAGNCAKKALKLKTLLSLVLQNNVFTFNGGFYKQINGTAMGTIMAPTYANCYLRAKEEAGLADWLKPTHPNVKLYKRYIDDIGCLFDNHDNKLGDFINAMKRAYSPLELTFKIGRGETPGRAIIYLDLELSLNDHNQRIDYEMHRKPSNNKSYIPSDSNHPVHMLHNTVYNDMLRAHRLCSTPATLKKHLAVISANARKQGYTKGQVQLLQNRATKKAAQPPTENANEPPPTILTLTYNGARTQKLASNLREYWTTHADPTAKLMLAYRTNPNMKDLLVRSKAPQQARPSQKTN
jgi:hypothetical protein